jgi:TrmH family RNA methyltransferase
MGTFHCLFLAAVKEWLDVHQEVCADEICCVSEEELQRASLMKTPQQVIAVFAQRKESFELSSVGSTLCLALDGIQNPGNLGTIIRLADWFGIEHIICSLDTADIYNPKTVQATMGAMAHVKTHYMELSSFFEALPDGAPVYGTLLNGNNIYEEKLTSYGVIVMGNEGRGIRPETKKFVNRRLYIPNYPQGRLTTDSLNVAIATSIVCAEFRRQAVY